MNAPDPLTPATMTYAELDGEDRLLSADPPLLTLNARAGGRVGQPLALPGLAKVARLARRLGIAVSRNVTVADDEVDLALDVQAKPTGEGVRLAVSGWRERGVWASSNPSAGDRVGSIGADAEESSAPPLPDQFTAGLDQALRRPLAQIIANADSINAATDGPIGEDYAAYAADIANAGRHLLALVDDLVDLQAVERADFMPAADRIDLADVARRAAGLLSVRASDAGVVIERPAPDAHARAIGDFRRALQILVNLIGNAVRYAPRGSIVLVSAANEGPAATVSVTDEGKGIVASDHARVFEKFERVDPSEAGGNGLGLYIARRLARAMGGDLALESAPGEGARFTLTLPADPSRDQDQH